MKNLLIIYLYIYVEIIVNHRNQTYVFFHQFRENRTSRMNKHFKCFLTSNYSCEKSEFKTLKNNTFINLIFLIENLYI